MGPAAAWWWHRARGGRASAGRYTRARLRLGGREDGWLRWRWDGVAGPARQPPAWSPAGEMENSLCRQVLGDCHRVGAATAGAFLQRYADKR